MAPISESDLSVSSMAIKKYAWRASTCSRLRDFVFKTCSGNSEASETFLNI